MSNVLEYDGFKAVVEFSAEDGLLVGEVLDVESVILFSAVAADDMPRAFKEAVDEYLLDCRHRGVDPEKPYSGTFNVRVGADVHRQANNAARLRNQSLNEFVRHALQTEVARNQFPYFAELQRSVSAELVTLVARDPWTTGQPESEYYEEPGLSISKPNHVERRH